MQSFARQGTQVTVYPGARVLGRERIVLGAHVRIDDLVFIGVHDALTIGHHVHVAPLASITGGGRCMLSDLVAVSSGARILTGSDDFSGAGLVGSTVPADLRRVHRGRVWLQRYCALGVNAIIMPDVTIGEGCVVCAGSTVMRDTEPWTVVAGSPARPVSTRPRAAILAAAATLFARHGLDGAAFLQPSFYDGRPL